MGCCACRYRDSVGSAVITNPHDREAVSLARPWIWICVPPTGGCLQELAGQPRSAWMRYAQENGTDYATASNATFVPQVCWEPLLQGLRDQSRGSAEVQFAAYRAWTAAHAHVQDPRVAVCSTLNEAVKRCKLTDFGDVLRQVVETVARGDKAVARELLFRSFNWRTDIHDRAMSVVADDYKARFSRRLRDGQPNAIVDLLLASRRDRVLINPLACELSMANRMIYELSHNLTLSLFGSGLGQSSTQGSVSDDDDDRRRHFTHS